MINTNQLQEDIQQVRNYYQTSSERYSSSMVEALRIIDVLVGMVGDLQDQLNHVHTDLDTLDERIRDINRPERY